MTDSDLKEDWQIFAREIRNRQIEYLVHFTPCINLLSIYENDIIMSRKKLIESNIDYNRDIIQFPDQFRLDDSSFINTSISFPNYFLFREFRKRKASEPYVSWCILLIAPKYIYFKETLFSVGNAASKISRDNYKIEGTYCAFLRLFQNNVHTKSRVLDREKLKAKYPTDVQAEVLVKDQVKLADILYVCFEDASILNSTKAALNEFDTSNFIVDDSLFKPYRL